MLSGATDCSSGEEDETPLAGGAEETADTNQRNSSNLTDTNLPDNTTMTSTTTTATPSLAENHRDTPEKRVGFSVAVEDACDDGGNASSGGGGEIIDEDIDDALDEG